MVVPPPSRHPFLALVNNASKGYRKGGRQCFLIIQRKPRATTTRKQAFSLVVSKHLAPKSNHLSKTPENRQL